MLVSVESSEEKNNNEVEVNDELFDTADGLSHEIGKVTELDRDKQNKPDE